MKRKKEDLFLVCINNSENGTEKIIAFCNSDDAGKCLLEQHLLYLQRLVDRNCEIVEDYYEDYEWKIEVNHYGKTIFYSCDICKCEWGEPDGN